MGYVRTLLVAGAVLSVATPLWADEAPRVAVVAVGQVNMTEGDAVQISQELAETLSARLAVDAVGGLDVSRVLPPEGVTASCLAEPTCLADIGRRTDADSLLLIVLIKLGSTTQLDITWVDVASGQTKLRPSLKFEQGPGQPTATFAVHASTLLPDAAPRVETVDRVAATSAKRRIDGPFIAAASISGLALATGIGFGISSLRAESRTKNDCDTTLCPNYDDDKQKMDNFALVADVMFGITVAAAGSALLLYFFNTDDSPSEGIAIGSGPGDLGVALTGRF